VTVTASADVPYPPEPWHLDATMHVSLWTIPVADLPASLDAALPSDAAPVVAGARALVGGAFVRYAPGGVLAYDELLVACLVRVGTALRVTVSDIWVDSPTSLAGGRGLWGIPKDLATFERRAVGHGRSRWRAERDGTVLAEALVAPGRRLPGTWAVPMSTTQRLDDAELTAPVRSVGRVRLGRAAWRFPADSPLAWLAGRRPATSVTLEDVALVFGSIGGSSRR
jgi:hypothetical protein